MRWRNQPQTLFWKIKIEHISGSKSLKLCTVCFFWMGSWGLSRYFENKLQNTCFYLILTFYKKRKRFRTSLLASFSAYFLKKNISLIYSINWPHFIVWLLLLCEILRNMCITILCKPGCDAMHFEVNLILLVKPFSLHDQKAATKTEISSE